MCILKYPCLIGGNSETRLCSSMFSKNNFNFIKTFKTWVLIDKISQLIRILSVAIKCTFPLGYSFVRSKIKVALNDLQISFQVHIKCIQATAPLVCMTEIQLEGGELFKVYFIKIHLGFKA